MYTSGFPVEAGVATSLARPGGNVTGLSIYAGGQLFGKYVELLREAAPPLRELAVLWDYAAPAFAEREIDVAVRELRRGAQALRVNVNLRMVRTDRDLTEALASLANSSPDALFATGGPIHNRRENAPRIADFAIRHRLPMLNEFRGLLFESGGLLLYAVDPQDLANRTAHFIERISRGATPAELPIEQPSKFDLIINLKTAKALGLTIPPSLLARADQVIE
jgi:putative ABC transport system substrate-binding protein